MSAPTSGTPRPPLPWLPAAAALAALAAGVWARGHPGWAAALGVAALLGAGRLSAPLAARGLAVAALVLLGVAGWRSGQPVSEPALPWGEELRLRGRLADDPRVTAGGLRAVVALEGVAPRVGGWEPAAGRLLVQVAGQPEPSPARGDGVLLRGKLRAPFGFRNPGSEGYAAYLARQGIGARVTARWPGEVAFAAPGPETPGWLRWRRTTARAMEAAVPGPPGAVLRALALGDRSGLTPATVESFRRAGTSHLVAISGLHLGMLALLVAPVLRALLVRLPRVALACPVDPLARALALPVLVAYAAVSGFQTSTLRALAMVGLWVLAALLGRASAPLPLLLGTALVLAAPRPGIVADPGFQLSLAAVAGLFWLAPALDRAWRRAPDPLERLAPPAPGVRFARFLVAGARRTLATSVAATGATLPLVVFHFGAGSVSGLLVNPLAVPLVGFGCLPLALAGTVLAGPWPWAADLLWRAAGVGLAGLLWLQDAVGGLLPPLEWAALRAPEGAVGGLVLVGCLGLRLAGARGRGLVLAGALGLALLVVPAAVRSGWAAADPAAHLWVLDVGQGQSVALRLPGGRWAVVDGGGFAGTPFDVGERVVVPALEALGARRLWLVVSTHPHPDHLEGLPAVVTWGRPEAVWLPGGFEGDARYRTLLAAAEAVGAEVSWVGLEGLAARVRAALLEARWVAARDENDRSMLVRLTLGARVALIPADLEAPGQRAHLAAGFDPRCDVLVAPHHGAKDALCPEWLAAAAPAHLFISAGGRPGLPSPAFEAAAAAVGAAVASTHRGGALYARLGPDGVRAAARVDSRRPIW